MLATGDAGSDHCLRVVPVSSGLAADRLQVNPTLSAADGPCADLRQTAAPGVLLDPLTISELHHPRIGLNPGICFGQRRRN